MGQWQQWVDKYNQSISRQRRPQSDIDQARRDLLAITEPMPAEVRWRSLVQSSNFLRFGEEGRGTLLEFLLSIGDMGLYRAFDPERGAVSGAMLLLGDDLVARGAKPTARMMEAALTTGLWNLDGPERLEAAFRWGGKAVWDPQTALAYCCEHSAWDEKGGEACFGILEREGALTSPTLNFESCSAQLHPVVRAALVSDMKTIARLIDRGVSLKWTDPETGLTLWHLASSLSATVGKALLPKLSALAPELAGAATLKEASITYVQNGKFRARQGQTALHCACDGIKPAALMAALACKAFADPVDGRGDSPLTLLSRRWGANAQTKAEPMAKALLEAGADPGRVDKKGLTPAQNMAAKGPLGALAALLAVRPQDVGADAPLAKEAFAQLAERGSEGRARAEEASMTVSISAGPVAGSTRSRKQSL